MLRTLKIAAVLGLALICLSLFLPMAEQTDAAARQLDWMGWTLLLGLFLFLAGGVPLGVMMRWQQLKECGQWGTTLGDWYDPRDYPPDQFHSEHEREHFMATGTLTRRRQRRN